MTNWINSRYTLHSNFFIGLQLSTWAGKLASSAFVATIQFTSHRIASQKSRCCYSYDEQTCALQPPFMEAAQQPPRILTVHTLSFGGCHCDQIEFWLKFKIFKILYNCQRKSSSIGVGISRNLGWALKVYGRMIILKFFWTSSEFWKWPQTLFS